MSRAKILFIFLTAWFAVILVRLGYLASGFAENHRISSATVSQRTYILPALRGKILDLSGTPLVWSEKHYDLEISGTLDDEEQEILKNKLSERNLTSTLSIGDEILSLTPKELTSLEKMVRNTPALHIKTRVVRVCSDHEEVRKLAGKLDPATGKGISGWEQEFDTLLSGRNGKFRITRNGSGRWLKNTGEIEALPIPGQNVKVPFKLPANSKGERR